VSVLQRVFDVSMSEHSHYVKNIFGFMVLHCGFQVKESVKGNLLYPWVLEFGCSSFALFLMFLLIKSVQAPKTFAVSFAI
jgi:hypothetical protein